MDLEDDECGQSKTIRTHVPLYSSSKKEYSILITTKYIVFPHLSILYIILYPLWSLLVTLSKYIHVTSCFEVFIERNLMVQSEFNLIL
jgi:hypothetical protein